METILGTLVTALLGGGPQAIVAILLVFIGSLCIERSRLLKEIAKKDERIEKIVDDYYKGNMTLTDALNSLKIALFEIKSKF